MLKLLNCLLFFFNDTATTEIYTLSLHDALPISPLARIDERVVKRDARPRVGRGTAAARRVGSPRCPAKHRHLHRAGQADGQRGEHRDQPAAAPEQRVGAAPTELCDEPRREGTA